MSCGGPVIVVDFGTATTHDLVLEGGVFHSGATSPGIRLAAAALWSGTAKLPEIEIKRPDTILAKDTVSSMQAGVFYGYGGPGWGHTFNGYNVKSIMEKYGCSSETRAMQHYLVDYLYDGESGFGGALSTTAKNMLKEIKAALAKMPDPTAMKLLPGLSVNATGKETESFTWKANEAFTITIHLENGVSLVNETTGKTASGNVTVKGGEKFHLVATTANMGSLKGKYAITSNFPLDFHAMLLKLESSQDIGFGYYTDSADLQITVDWPEEAVIEITKKDGDTGKNLAGAVYIVITPAQS